jgi:protocatechuate 3,4-dioxygenase alpha subunit
MYTTSSQTIGPYLHIGMTWAVDPDFAGPEVEGDRISVSGRVVDGDGKPVNDAMLEIWQANAHGRYAHPEDARDVPLDRRFSGWGRVVTDEHGGFRFNTIKPGRVPAPDGTLQAPHLCVTIFMRGMLRHLCTRVYFDGDAANAGDAVLSQVPAERRGTLMARGTGGTLEWNVVLQGRGETVFFAV